MDVGRHDEDEEMTKSGSLPEELAVAVVARALELIALDEIGSTSSARMDDALLASSPVRAAIARVPGSEVARWNEVMTRLAISLSRDVVKLWSDVYPDRLAPLMAIEAAETWAACPCMRHADAAAETARGAAHQAMAVWRVPPKEAAWAGRTAAWVADAPKYGWQTVTAIYGACRATSQEHAVAATARFFSTEIGSR
jgi:hypothetical protein